MAGTADLVLRGFGGVAVRDDALWFDPLIPRASNDSASS
jgi:trehalose/maltose hydrolase-like predicted phosphorylase